MIFNPELHEIEEFATSIGPDTKSAWLNPYAMAQTMLTLARGIRQRDGRIQEQLRAWDSITLDISYLIEQSGDMSKKQIRERLAEIYGTKRWPSGDQS